MSWRLAGPPVRVNLTSSTTVRLSRRWADGRCTPEPTPGQDGPAERGCPLKSVAEQIALIRRGVDQITPESDLVRKLTRSVETNQPLRVKYGIDPTGIDVHL